VMRGEHAWLETGIISLLDEHAPANASPPKGGARSESRVEVGAGT
jgi:hypothetical protein